MLKDSAKAILAALIVILCVTPLLGAEEVVTVNRQETGYRGIWYFNQVSEFDLVKATRQEGDQTRPIDNFSYMQAWHVASAGRP